MRLLLDTCTFLWLIIDDDSLTNRVKDLFVNRDNEVFFSVVSAWEIAVKYAIGRIDLPDEPQLYIPEQREHNDPFDRMLISQALIHGLTILTPNELIKKYPVRIFW